MVLKKEAINNSFQKRPVISFSCYEFTEEYLEKLGNIKKRSKFINSCIANHIGILGLDKRLIRYRLKCLIPYYYKYSKRLIRCIRKYGKSKVDDSFQEYKKGKIFHFRLDEINNFHMPKENKSKFIRDSILIDLVPILEIRKIIKINTEISVCILRKVGSMINNKKKTGGNIYNGWFSRPVQKI